MTNYTNPILKQIRFETSIKFMQSIIAADWKFDVSDKTWDEQAIERSIALTDLLINKLRSETND